MQFTLISVAIYLAVAVFVRNETPAQKLVKLGALGMFLWGVSQVYQNMSIGLKIGVGLTL